VYAYKLIKDIDVEIRIAQLIKREKGWRLAESSRYLFIGVGIYCCIGKGKRK